MPIMTPTHPRWSEFICALSDALRGVCSNTLEQSRKVLATMNVDVEGSITYFKDHGGFCDCEVIMNVDMS